MLQRREGDRCDHGVGEGRHCHALFEDELEYGKRLDDVITERGERMYLPMYDTIPRLRDLRHHYYIYVTLKCINLRSEA